MFASRNLVEHVARGVTGFGLLILTIMFGSSYPWLALATIALSLIALRGCPMCWTIGLVQTAYAKARGHSTDALCKDGACALVRRHPPPTT